MTQTQHTAGPWRAETQGGGGFEIVGRPTWPCTRFGVDNEWSIATVDDLSMHNDPLLGIEGRANARLIAAAPKMLEALQLAANEISEAEGYTGDSDAHSHMRAAQNAINAAISKATGAS